MSTHATIFKVERGRAKGRIRFNKRREGNTCANIYMSER